MVGPGIKKSYKMAAKMAAKMAVKIKTNIIRQLWAILCRKCFVNEEIQFVTRKGSAEYPPMSVYRW